jgi:carboxylate-amine ligase
MINYKHFTVGIEEEYMVIDPATKALISHEQKIVAEGQKIISEKVKAEMHQAVVEVGTDVCDNIEDARHDIYNLRKTIHGIADSLGFSVGAAGTHPFSTWRQQLITDHIRYQEIVNEMQACACWHALQGNGHSHCQLCQVFSSTCVCTECQLPFLGRKGNRIQIIQDQGI